MSDFLECCGIAVLVLVAAILFNGGCQATIGGKAYSFELKPKAAQPLQPEAAKP